MSALLALVILISVILLIRQFTHGQPADRYQKPKNRSFCVQVHGSNHKNTDGSSRQKIISNCSEGETVQLIPEPTNAYDPDAIMVCRKNGEQIGYVEADQACRIAPDMTIGWTYRATIDEIYKVEQGRNRYVRLRLEVLTMSRATEARRAGMHQSNL